MTDLALQQPIESAAAHTLLEQYSSGDFFFNSPTRAMLASDWRISRSIQGSDAEQTLQALFKEGADGELDAPIVVGVLPFADDRPGCLMLPNKVRSMAPIGEWAAREPEPSLDLQAIAATPIPDYQGYCTNVATALEEFRSGRLSKLVLARTLKVKTRDSVPIAPVLQRLMKRNPDAYVFASPTTPEGGSVFLGASPELIVRRTGRHISVNPLAGSTARRADAKEDQAAAAELLRSPKDLYEHSFVVEDIVRLLTPLCRELHVPEGPELLSTNKLWHLSTRIEGELADPATTSLAVARALHPTPAVCGVPTQDAFAAIRRWEGFERELFSGMVGWCDANGDGEWALSLRCAQASANELVLYAGAGTVEGSDPDAEFAETGTKLGTMLAAFGLDERLGQLHHSTSLPSEKES
ncbi:isochorismate synthase [Carnimonas nigrificans]|uniref:isochorismate synthase n=1 Tax=Carnimonas nigrificans TaxID=64323 RepID=UPI00047002F9|nr:isochorismate synthase [Carnimonas nigrificans]